MLAGLGVAWVFYPVAPKEDSPSGREVFLIPRGRVLQVIVGGDGVYLGQEFIPFLLFRKHLEEHRGDFRVKSVRVFGTDTARYGAAVQVYATVLDVLKIRGTVDSRVVPASTRLEAIIVEHHGD